MTRADLVRYAGASGDFNPIHWSDRIATAVGLPGVIAHGMFTMALVGRAVTDWAGRAGRGGRVRRPVHPAGVGAGRRRGHRGRGRRAWSSEVTEDGLTRLDLTVTCGGEKVLAQARATVRTAR